MLPNYFSVTVGSGLCGRKVTCCKSAVFPREDFASLLHLMGVEINFKAKGEKFKGLTNTIFKTLTSPPVVGLMLIDVS